MKTGLKKIAQVRTGLLLALLSGFLLFLYAPMELYVNNVNDFTYDIYYLLRTMIPIFLGWFIIVTILFIVAKKAGEKAYLTFISLFAGMFIALYIQGTFFSGNLPPLDGRHIDWQQYDSQRIPSLLIWIFSVVVFLAVYKILGGKIIIKILNGICCFGLAMLFLSSVFICFSEGSLDKKSGLFVTDDHFFEFSNDENFIIMLLDCVDADAFSQAVDANPDFVEDLKDFTFFQNNVGSYPYTSRSMPVILSGIWHENNQSYSAYCEDVFSQAPIFNEMKNRGFRMEFYCHEFENTDSLPEYFENVKGSNRRNFSMLFVKGQLKMVGLKYFPYDVKKFCIISDRELNAGVDAVDGSYYQIGNDAIIDSISSACPSSSDAKMFRYVYTAGAHPPYSAPSRSGAFDDNGYISGVEYCTSLAVDYINMLRNNEFYDNTAIVILADHGYCGDDDFGRQNPLLLMKGMGENHDFTVSQAPVCHDDLQRAYLRLIDGASAEESFDAQEGDERNRRYMYYTYGAEEYLSEYYQTGYASDESTMVPTGKQYNRRDFQWFTEGIRNHLS